MIVYGKHHSDAAYQLAAIIKNGVLDHKGIPVGFCSAIADDLTSRSAGFLVRIQDDEFIVNVTRIASHPSNP